MSVTDKQCEHGSRLDSRNAVEESVREFSAWLDTDEGKERTRRNEEKRQGRMCIGCDKPFAPDEAVYRVWFHKPHKWRHSIETVCKDCAGYLPEGSWENCEACGRTFYQMWRYGRWHHACCEACARKVYNRNQRIERQSVECEVCGEHFEPPRSDAKTCSPKCRQKAYRKRKALRIDQKRQRAPGNTRNARARP